MCWPGAAVVCRAAWARGCVAQGCGGCVHACFAGMLLQYVGSVWQRARCGVLRRSAKGWCGLACWRTVGNRQQRQPAGAALPWGGAGGVAGQITIL